MNQEQKIGIILPQSNAYPLIGKEFTNGLKLGIGTAHAKLIIESIGFGADPNQTVNTIQKLSFQEDVHLITGLIGYHGFAEVAQFASQNELTLLAATMGAKETDTTPHGVFQNSLGLCNSLKDLVAWFDENGKEKIATSSCYYESGYGFFSALESGMHTTKNTEFAGHFITPLHPREDEDQLMKDTFEAINPDAVVAFHNGIYANEHAAFLKKNHIQKKFPLYCLPFSCEDKLLREFPDVFDQVQVVSSWYAELENPENEAFIAAYYEKYGKKPSFFALLGYENGLIIRNCLDKPTHQVTETIQHSEIAGPRGTIQFGKDGKTQFPNYLWEINYNNDNQPERKQVQKLKQNITKSTTQESNQTGGWFNAYLCH